MTKLIAALAMLAALAWGVTATASWITRKRAPFALGPGNTPSHASGTEEDRAMLRAHWPLIIAAIFALVMFAALLRISIAVAGQASIAIAMTAGLSLSGGLLMFSALPAPRRTDPKSGRQKDAPALQRFTSIRSLLLPATVFLVSVAWLLTTGLTSSADSQGRYVAFQIKGASTQISENSYPGWYYGIPLLLVIFALAGSAFLALRRISTTVSLPDPRMATLDLRWRELTTRLLLKFTSGVLLVYLGGVAFLTGLALTTVANAAGPHGTEPLQPLFAVGLLSTGAGVAVAVTGVVLLVLTAQGVLRIRVSARLPANNPAKDRTA